MIAGLVGVPLIRRQVARDWEELQKAEVIPELHSASTDADVSEETHIANRSCLACPGEGLGALRGEACTRAREQARARTGISSSKGRAAALRRPAGGGLHEVDLPPVLLSPNPKSTRLEPAPNPAGRQGRQGL